MVGFSLLDLKSVVGVGGVGNVLCRHLIRYRCWCRCRHRHSHLSFWSSRYSPLFFHLSSFNAQSTAVTSSVACLSSLLLRNPSATATSASSTSAIQSQHFRHPSTPRYALSPSLRLSSPVSRGVVQDFKRFCEVAEEGLVTVREQKKQKRVSKNWMSTDGEDMKNRTKSKNRYSLEGRRRTRFSDACPELQQNDSPVASVRRAFPFLTTEEATSNRPSARGIVP